MYLWNFLIILSQVIYKGRQVRKLFKVFILFCSINTKKLYTQYMNFILQGLERVKAVDCENDGASKCQVLEVIGLL